MEDPINPIPMIAIRSNMIRPYLIRNGNKIL